MAAANPLARPLQHAPPPLEVGLVTGAGAGAGAGAVGGGGEPPEPMTMLAQFWKISGCAPPDMGRMVCWQIGSCVLSHFKRSRPKKREEDES